MLVWHKGMHLWRQVQCMKYECVICHSLKVLWCKSDYKRQQMGFPSLFPLPITQAVLKPSRHFSFHVKFHREQTEGIEHTHHVHAHVSVCIKQRQR